MVEAVRIIQTQLQLDQYYKGFLDGTWGSKSQEALREAIDSGKYRLYFDFSMYKKQFKVRSIDQNFVDNINNLFNTFNDLNKQDGSNPLYVAYLLATVHHETDKTFKPLAEYGKGKGKRYGSNIDVDGSRYLGLDHIYYGRGYSQITWLTNYQKFSKLLGIDLVNNPDLAMRSDIAAQILVVGSLKGLFTGKSLGSYIEHGYRSEFVQARRVINGMDKASVIAGYAESFLTCIILHKI